MLLTQLHSPVMGNSGSSSKAPLATTPLEAARQRLALASLTHGRLAAHTAVAEYAGLMLEVAGELGSHVRLTILLHTFL